MQLYAQHLRIYGTRRSISLTDTTWQTLSLLRWCVLTMGLDPPVGGLHEVLAGGGASFEVALIVRSRARVLAKVTLEFSSGVFTMVLSLELETKV